MLFTTPKISPGSLDTNCVCAIEELPDVEKTDSKEEFSCLNWAIYKTRRKVCLNFKTDADNIKIAVYRYQSHF